MNIFQFLYSLISDHVPGDADSHQVAVNHLTEQWSEIPANKDGGFLEKAKFYLDNPLAKLALAALSVVLAKWVSNKLADWIGDQNGDGEITTADMLEGAANSIAEAARRLKAA